MKSWTPLSISRRITCCIIFRRIFSNCVMRRWPGAAPRSLPTAAASGCWRRTTAACRFMSAIARSARLRYCMTGCWLCSKRIPSSRRAILSSWWRISIATAPIFRRSSAAPAASAGCRGRYPTGGPANRIRRCRRLSPCFRCPTAALPAKTCWRCWMCRCWPRALTLTKRGYATCASGLTNPAYAGEWMTTTCVNSISRLPASIPGALA